MADSGDALVLVDSSGSYYVLPKEVIEQARVPDEAKDLVEAQMGDDDTSGFATAGLGYSMVGAMTLQPSRFSATSSYRLAWPCDTGYKAGWPCDISTSPRFGSQG
jgi:hypothetical protein